MRCGRLNCRTPIDGVRQVKGVTLCMTHRLMLWGSFEPTTKMAKLSPEERRAVFAKRFKRQDGGA